MFPDDSSPLALVNDGSESGRALVVSTLEVNRRESGCLTAMQMAEHRWACQSVVDGVRRLVAFDDDGGRRHERVLPSRLDGTLTDWRPGMAAADPGTLLLLADTGEPLHARLFAFADRDGLPIAASVDVAPATLTGADHEPPAIADDGTVVVSVSGHLSAFRSNLNGLAPAAYPRGPRHGGNMNLGARRAMNH